MKSLKKMADQLLYVLVVPYELTLNKICFLELGDVYPHG